jgi:hypothetical protein
VDVGDVADVSEVPAASILDPEDGGSMYLWNVGTIAHIRKV